MKNLLALDISSKTGFCTRSGSGVWNLTPRKDESAGMKHIKFKAKLKELCSAEDISVVAFEGAVNYSKFPNFVAQELVGVLKLFCEENNIEYKSYMPTVIKKAATGKGNSKKEVMVQAAKDKYGIEVIDDNHADALHIYHFAIQDLGL